MITLHSLRQSQKKSRPKRVGRGNASGKGTTAGRGTKGQRARTGGRNKLIRRGMKHLIERTPKTRGFHSRRQKMFAVNLADLQRVFPDGATITTAELHRHNLIARPFPGAKILGTGELKKKFIIRVEAFSASAKAAVIKAGGQALVVEPVVPQEPKKE